MKLSDYTHSLENSTLFVTASNYSKNWKEDQYIVVGSRAIWIGFQNWFCSTPCSFERMPNIYYSDIEVRDGALYIGKHYAGDLPSTAVLKSEHTCA
jgi:hypothetical protein